MNPPFGTRNTGVDTAFVLKGMEYASTVYSLHKTSTREVTVNTSLQQFNLYRMHGRTNKISLLHNYLALCATRRGTRLQAGGAGRVEV